MGRRNKPHPDNPNYSVGAEIDDTDSADLIREHAREQLCDEEEIGAILVQIVTPGKPDSRWLTYTSRKKGNNGQGRGYEAKKVLDNKPIDKVETITALHSNPWYINVGGLWMWIC